MAELTVNMTYADALLGAAREAGIEDTVLEESSALLQLLHDDAEFKAFVNYPAISAVEKKKTLQEIFEGRICEELLNFLYVLVDKRRTSNLEGIIKEYRKLVEREEGYSYGTVYSVIRLSDERIAELEEETSKLLQTKVRLVNEIDTKLIAGIKIMIDGKLIDASYRKRFDELASQISIS